MKSSNPPLEIYNPGEGHKGLFREEDRGRSRAFLISAAVDLSSGLRYLTSRPDTVRILGGSFPPSRIRWIFVSFLIPWDRSSAVLMHLARPSHLPAAPQRSLSGKSGEVSALWPMMTKLISEVSSSIDLFWSMAGPPLDDGGGLILLFMFLLFVMEAGFLLVVNG